MTERIHQQPIVAGKSAIEGDSLGWWSESVAHRVNPSRRIIGDESAETGNNHAIVVPK